MIYIFYTFTLPLFPFFVNTKQIRADNYLRNFLNQFSKRFNHFIAGDKVSTWSDVYVPLNVLTGLHMLMVDQKSLTFAKNIFFSSIIISVFCIRCFYSFTLPPLDFVFVLVKWSKSVLMDTLGNPGLIHWGCFDLVLKYIE